MHDYTSQHHTSQDHTNQLTGTAQQLQLLQNACIKGPFVFRPPEKRKSVINFRFSFFSFGKQLGKQN